MSFPTYGSYKQSGEEWLGNVPSHWAVLPLKASYSILGGATPKSDNSDYWDGDVPWITPGDLSISKSVYVRDTARSISEAGLASCAANLVPIDSVILSTRAPIGSLGISTVPTAFNQGCKALVSRERKPPHYLAYFLECAKIALNVRGKGTTFLELSGDELGRFKMPSPPLPEQERIAAFLDRETARIDALVEAQERLIALLKEKRQASISHAVTKGLDPSTPMKDSGVEWLGQVPAHWEVTSVKHAIEFATSGPRGWSDIIGGGDATFFQSQHIGRAMDIVLDGAARITPPDDTDAERARLTEDDVVVCITGARTGAVAHVRDLSAETYINQHVCLLRPLPARAKGRFLAYFLFSHGGQEQFALAMYGLKQGLGLDQVRAQSVALPPLDDQQLIADWLDRMLGQFSGLISSAEAAINLLQERRAALISAAVTGKIDVRGRVQTTDAA